MNWLSLDGLNTFLILIVSASLFGCFKIYMPAYLTEKAKNLASKEDLNKLTRIVEKVRSAYAVELERVRADHARELEEIRSLMVADLHVYQTRYNREFDILTELAEKLIPLRNAALALRPALDFTNSDEPEEERKKNRLDDWAKAADAFRNVAEFRRPFYPEEIYNLCIELVKKTRSEAISYGVTKYNPQKDEEYWEQAEKNGDEIAELANQVLDGIRSRAQSWEKLRMDSVTPTRSL